MQVRVENFEKVFFVVADINSYTPHYAVELCVLSDCRDTEQQQIQDKKNLYLSKKKSK